MKKAIFGLIILTGLLSAEALPDSESLLDYLHQEHGWELLKEDGEQRIEIKDGYGLKLHAVKISQVVDIEPELLVDVFENVESYPDVLSSAAGVEFDVIRRDENYVDGYQHLSVPIVRDRHYIYRMRRVWEDQSWIRTDWHLLPEHGEHKPLIQSRGQQKKNPLYLERGVGSFLVERLEDEKILASYRLYIDPGGRLPDFLVNMVNESSIVGLFEDVVREASRRQTEGQM